ncbi:MAG: hypothetical protein U5R49_06705 [Deltaproteobacteria bacterium]|nr:hypothetical protein [Deltaproteobacteria bacterium]
MGDGNKVFFNGLGIYKKYGRDPFFCKIGQANSNCSFNPSSKVMTAALRGKDRLPSMISTMSSMAKKSADFPIISSWRENCSGVTPNMLG